MGIGVGQDWSRRQQSPNHVAFTARLIRTGHAMNVAGRSAGAWGIGVVEERFWGWRSSDPSLVLLRNSIYWEGETYFVSGFRSQGFLTRHLPIVTATHCGQYYAVPLIDPLGRMQLRVLHEPPAGEFRLIGTVLSQKPRPAAARALFGRLPGPDLSAQLTYDAMFNPAYSPLPNARIRIQSAADSRIAISDKNGIYAGRLHAHAPRSAGRPGGGRSHDQPEILHQRRTSAGQHSRFYPGPHRR